MYIYEYMYSGICDCCDGLDEHSHVCTNTCEQDLQHIKQTALLEHRAIQAGLMVIYVCVCVCMCSYKNMFMCVCMYVYIHIYIYIYTYIYIYIYMCIYVYIYVYIYIYIYLHSYISTRILIKLNDIYQAKRKMVGVHLDKRARESKSYEALYKYLNIYTFTHIYTLIYL
jgi:hypothetical protein